MEEAQFQLVIEAISAGCGLCATLENLGIPTSRWYSHLARLPHLQKEVAGAREAAAHLMADQAREIADTDTDPQRARVRVDIRKWLASKWQPRTYGDKLDLNVTGSVDIATRHARALAYARSMRDQPQVRDAQDAELIEHRPAGATDAQSVPALPAAVDIFS